MTPDKTTTSHTTYAVADDQSVASALQIRTVPLLGFSIGLSTSINQLSDLRFDRSQLTNSSKYHEYFLLNRTWMTCEASSTGIIFGD